jgi:hypothetical protein
MPPVHYDYINLHTRIHRLHQWRILCEPLHKKSMEQQFTLVLPALGCHVFEWNWCFIVSVNAYFHYDYIFSFILSW